MKQLSEATVLITGASGGIGKACARAFLAAGSRVLVSGTDETRRASVEELLGERCAFVAADLRDPEAPRRLIEATVNRFGGLDVLMNNAAVISPMKPVDTSTLEEFDLLASVNLRAVFLLCKHAYPHLKRSAGCIITMSSMSGVIGERHHAIYSAMKGGVHGLTKAMAIDWGPVGIRCNAICPSSVLTPRTDEMIAQGSHPEAIVEFRKTINHLGYTASADEIASVAVFLASPAASFITGAIIPVSGGAECGYGVKPS
jgi:meso-butanediol dehydrogenase/(S,S)-butanediol dehydrogenase/diacetyl reductase